MGEESMPAPKTLFYSAMDTELKRFLHDQKRLKRGLPPAQWTPFKKELAQRNRLGRELRHLHPKAYPESANTNPK